MTSKKKTPRLLILENDPKIQAAVEDTLVPAGWEVDARSSSEAALDSLRAMEADAPYAIFISSFSPPDMELDTLLKHARSIAPSTQRMLMVTAEDTTTLISAINKAGINACITFPFGGHDLVDQAATCLKNHSALSKREQLKRFTVYQNQKMFQLAQKLKKKEKNLSLRIEQKKGQKEILINHTQNRPQPTRSAATAKDPLHQRMVQNETIPSLETFETEFEKLEAHITQFYDQLAQSQGLEKVDPVPANLADKTPMDEELLEKLLLNSYVDPDSFLYPDTDPEEEEEYADPYEEFVYLTISKDGLTATLTKQKKAQSHETKSLKDLKDYLERKNLTQGLIPDLQLEAWLATATRDDPPLTVAEGTAPIQGRDGVIDFSFPTDYTNPGKILEDGSIDFRERGDIPFVRQGDLLATRIPMEEGSSGINVFGDTVPPNPVDEPSFSPGEGTVLSEDGLQLFAELDGQPNVDPMGIITVNPELTINGDVDFETGNIDFNGNVMVTGTVKPGFTVRGVNLTAKEVQGAKVHIRGDLCVSAGITEAEISARGNIFCKYINNSQIKAFGDLIAHKEIIDSTILISGVCRDTTGHIISSKITAKKGIEGNRIGTDASSPPHLKVGVDDHTRMFLQEIELKLKKSIEQLEALRGEIQTIEDKDQRLYEEITVKAQAQEAAQRKMVEIKERITPMGMKDPKRMDALKELKRFADKSKRAETALAGIFERQDQYAQEIQIIQKKIEAVEKSNQNQVIKKKAIREFSEKEDPVAMVEVKGTIAQGTTIQGPNSLLALKDVQSRCRIQEVAQGEEGIQYHEMTILNL